MLLIESVKNCICLFFGHLIRASKFFLLLPYFNCLGYRALYTAGWAAPNSAVSEAVPKRNADWVGSKP
jgi:hypothetical protein